MATLPRWIGETPPTASLASTTQNRSRPQPTARASQRPPARGQQYSIRANETVALARQRPTRPPTGNVVVPAGWASWRSILVTIRGLPRFATPLHVRNNFYRHGNIIYIDVDDDRRNSQRMARFRFEPPPKDITPFCGFCDVDIDGRTHRVRIDYTAVTDDGNFTTPLGNACPPFEVINPARVRFGVLIEPTKFLALREVTSLAAQNPVKLVVDFRKRKFMLDFPLRLAPTSVKTYRVDIKFDAIKDVHQVRWDGGLAVVITVLDSPPVWEKRRDVHNTFPKDRMTWNENEMWQRTTHIGNYPQELRTEPLSTDGDDSQMIDLGRWTTYSIVFDRGSASTWTAIEAHLRDWNIKTQSDSSLTIEFRADKKKADVWAMLDDNISSRAGSLNEELALVGAAGIHISLRFDVRYQLEVCISHGIINEYSIGADLIEKLIYLTDNPKWRDGKDPDRARLVLEYAADQGKRIWRPMDLFSNDAAMRYFPSTMIIPEYCALMRKVIVTPTKMYFKTPTVETTNRVIRQFKHVRDNFIRLQFTDEVLEGRINGCEGDRLNNIFHRAIRVVSEGIRMGSWHWKFLAFGNSQIRENGAFFFCEPEANEHGVVTRDEIRKWMGSFDHIESIPKYAARVGQCFSTTRLVPGILVPTIVKIPDIERHGYCFTDGVGKISPLLAEMIARDWDLEEVPPAVQFRMGGCKGVLVTWPDIKATEVHIRKSQEKFEAVFNGLEVIKCAQFSCATLNRQTITILSCLGVPDHVFEDMMAAQVSSYNEAMSNKELAVKLLEQCVDENQTTLAIAKMLSNGFMGTHDPFVQTCLQLWRSWSIKSLKEKARLTVSQGSFVLGCVDETGTLQGHSKSIEGQAEIDINKLPQIFITVPKAWEAHEPRNYRVITGLCIVGRNPSLHPGDIRVVNAVDVPALHHLKPGVVAFPKVGDQDIPSMCSGGDLDGDDFFVIWDQNLIPTEWGHPPMNYEAAIPAQDRSGEKTKEEVMAYFLVLYMKLNNLPLIAHAHLAQADFEVEGAKHPKCLNLAKLHSTAVDFVKTGIPANWTRSLEPRRWPHFMEKSPKNSYKSMKALGKIYDMVKHEKCELKGDYDHPFDQRILSKFDLGEDLLKKARQLKSQYDIAMRRIMGQLEIGSEFEVWTTFVLSRPRVGTAYKLQEKVGRESAALKQTFRALCVQAVGGSRDYDVLAPFVAAMYRVTWEELRIALLEARQPHIVGPDRMIKPRKITPQSMPLISFPWLFDTVLGNIAGGGDPTQRLHVYPNKMKSVKPLRGEAVTILEDQPEDLRMGITRTDDGQVIHRGEILHLFHHEKDDDAVVGVVEGGGASDVPEQTSPPVSEKEDSIGVWELDPRLTGRSTSGDEDQNAGEASGSVVQNISTPEVKATTLPPPDDVEELISFYTPSSKKQVVKTEEGGASEDDANTLVEEYLDVGPGGDQAMRVAELDEKPEIVSPLLAVPALEPAGVEVPLSEEGDDADLGSDFEPEGGYEEVVIEKEMSALERLAKVLGE
ncbi:RNA dependent RNA polymerase domain containing protein [Rhypophila decipiens]